MTNFKKISGEYDDESIIQDIDQILKETEESSIKDEDTKKSKIESTFDIEEEIGKIRKYISESEEIKDKKKEQERVLLKNLFDGLKHVKIKIQNIEEGFEGSRKELDDKIVESEREQAKSQIRIIEVVGIFVALFTFISVNIQIFRKVCDILEAISFMALMGGMTGLIILTVHLALPVSRNGSSWVAKFVVLAVIFLLLIGSAVLHFVDKYKVNIF